MEWVFLDASGIIALLNKSDSLHKQAKQIYRSFLPSNYIFLTTDLVLLEVGNVLSELKFKNAVIKYLKSLQDSPKVKIVYTQKSDFEIGLKRYEKYRDKDWGLVDCISFELMEKYGCKQAFTHDHHFRQANFSVLIP